MPETHNREYYVLTVEDGFKRHSCAYPINNKEAATISRVLVDNYFMTFGLPSSIHSDNGKEFVNRIIEQLMDRLQIIKRTPPVYNPNSNIVERWHRTWDQMIRVYTERKDTEWSRALPAMVFAYNTKVHSATNMTPYMAMYGR